MGDRAQDGGSLTANSTRVLTVLGAIASGIGVIGFVTVVGGAVLWIRFNTVSVPADKAVAAVPSGELVAVGLSTLIPFIALALGVVFLAWLFAANNVVPTGLRSDLHARWAGEYAAPSVSTTQPGAKPAGPGAPPSLSVLAQAALAAARTVADQTAATEAAARIGSTDLAKEHDENTAKALEDVHALVPQAEGSLKDASIDPANLLADADALRERARKAHEAAVMEAERRTFGVRVRVIGASVLLVICEMAIVLVSQSPAIGHALLLVVLGLVLAAGTVFVGWRTQGFALFGASLFITVLLFGTVRTLVRTLDHPKLQPMALLRSGSDRGMTGYYIAETGDRIYLARVDAQQVLHGGSFDKSRPRIVTVPRSSVVAMAIGPLMERKAGLVEAAQLLRELCAEKVAEPPSQTTASGGKKPAAKNPCPPT